MGCCSKRGERVELFDGKSMDGWLGYSPDGKHPWRVVGDVGLAPDDPKKLEVKPGSGIFINGLEGRGFAPDLYTEFKHGDCQLHIEWLIPAKSNSGVYLMGKYEIQIVDSWGTTELRPGMAGGLYPQWVDGKNYGGHAPRVNATRAPGEWQTYDVVFHAPRFDENGNKIANARFVSVVWNGHLVHEDAEVEGPTRAAMRDGEELQEYARGPLMLQGDHGPVAYRNVWLVDLT